MPVTPADMTDEQHTLIEHLAQRCPHQPEPCDPCTELAVWAVATVIETGWWAQIDHYHNR